MKKYTYILAIAAALAIDTWATRASALLIGLGIVTGYLIFKFIEGLCTPDR